MANGPKQHSKETKQKISEAIKGRSPWNKGGVLSPEIRAKISAANMGRYKNKDIVGLLDKEQLILNELAVLRNALREQWAKEHGFEVQCEKDTVDKVKEKSYCGAVEIGKELGHIPTTSAAIRQKRYRDRKKGLLFYEELNSSPTIDRMDERIQKQKIKEKWRRNLKAGKLNSI